MNRPILVSYKLFDTILKDQFGLYGNITLSFEDMLEEPIRISELARISACQFTVPIEGVTHTEQVVRIPVENLDTLFTLYVPERQLWLMYIQSNIDKDKAYAWRIVYKNTRRKCIIHPWNAELSDAGWKLEVTDQLQQYVNQYKGYLESQSEFYKEFPRQFPMTPDSMWTPDPATTAGYTVQQIVTKLQAEIPKRSPELDALEAELYKLWQSGMINNNNTI